MSDNTQTSQSIGLDWSKFMAEMEIKDNKTLETLVKTCGIDVTTAFDLNGFSLIHHATVKCVPNKVAALIKIAQVQ